VDISGTKYAESQDLLNAMKMEASSAGNGVEVRAVRPAGDRGNLGARFIIRVPRRTELQNVQSSNGSIHVEDVEGDARLVTSNGSVHLAKIRGNVDAHTSNGTVEVNDVDGRMSFTTSNGSVHAENVQGAFEAATSNGSVRAHLREGEAGQAIKLTSSNGPLDLTIDSPRQNDVVARTSNASVTVRIPAGSNASVHAVTNSTGAVRSDFDITTRGVLSRNRIEGTIGSGGPKFDLTTSNGNIRLLRL
jgi:DUF4097 and DUF4098 domain-containing protein YvlB